MFEKHLKKALYSYVHSEEAKRERLEIQQIDTVTKLCEFIRETHQDYLEAMIQVEVDCQYIVSLCHRVVDIILYYFEQRMPIREVIPA